MRAALKNSHFLVGLVKACREIGPDLARLRWQLRRGALIHAYVQENKVRKLQIGCGKNFLPGWLNSDYFPRDDRQIFLDATKKFPFEDATFDRIFSEHVIEHLVSGDGLWMLKECSRVLKPGGKIRIATPNLEKIAGLVTAQKTTGQQNYIKLATEKYIPQNRRHQASFVVNNFFWDFGHFFVYDPETLKTTLEDAGFSGVAAWEPGQSDDAELKGVESHGGVIGEEMNRFETFVLQATKA